MLKLFDGSALVAVGIEGDDFIGALPKHIDDALLKGIGSPDCRWVFAWPKLIDDAHNAIGQWMQLRDVAWIEWGIKPVPAFMGIFQPGQYVQTQKTLLRCCTRVVYAQGVMQRRRRAIGDEQIGSTQVFIASGGCQFDIDSFMILDHPSHRVLPEDLASTHALQDL